MKAQILHGLKVVSGVLAAISGFSILFHLVPGKLGTLSLAVLGLVVGLEGLLALLEKEIESGVPLDKAIPAMAKEAAEIVDEVEKVAKAAEPFAPKGK